MSDNLPLVSVVIVNYNGKVYVEHCVNSVLKITYPNIEIIVADNGSTDDSVLCLKRKFGCDKRLKVLEILENKGPAFARNRAVEIATGKYIAFLDNDTEPAPNWLEPLVETMEDDPTIGACQCKLLLMKERDKIDYAGDYISNLGFLIQRVPGGEIDTGEADSKDEILSAKSAAMCIRTDVFNEVGGFDEDYFIYVEETDLGWRVWLSGYRIIFVPESIVYHEFGTSQVILGVKQNYLVKFHGTKNYITTVLKNFGSFNLFKILPIHIICWILIAFWILAKGHASDAKNIFKGIFWVFLRVNKILKKRSIIQKTRKVTDRDLMPIVMKRKSISYFYKKLTVQQKMGNTESFYRSKTQKMR